MKPILGRSRAIDSCVGNSMKQQNRTNSKVLNRRERRKRRREEGSPGPFGLARGDLGNFSTEGNEGNEGGGSEGEANSRFVRSGSRDRNTDSRMVETGPTCFLLNKPISAG